MNNTIKAFQTKLNNVLGELDSATLNSLLLLVGNEVLASNMESQIKWDWADCHTALYNQDKDE